MFAALKNILLGNGRASKELARSRLHFVLVQDRTGLTPEEMASFKKAMVDVIQKYFIIDEQAFDIAYKRDSDITTLVINSPVVTRRQDVPGYQVGARHEKKDQAQSKRKKDAGASPESAASPESVVEGEGMSEPTPSAHAG